MLRSAHGVRRPCMPAIDLASPHIGEPRNSTKQILPEQAENVAIVPVSSSPLGLASNTLSCRVGTQ